MVWTPKLVNPSSARTLRMEPRKVVSMSCRRLAVTSGMVVRLKVVQLKGSPPPQSQRPQASLDQLVRRVYLRIDGSHVSTYGPRFGDPRAVPVREFFSPQDGPPSRTQRVWRDTPLLMARGVASDASCLCRLRCGARAD